MSLAVPESVTMTCPLLRSRTAAKALLIRAILDDAEALLVEEGQK